MTRKRIKWKKGVPLIICPNCGGNSEPDFVDFSRAGKPAVVVMKCKCGKAWGIEVDQAKQPDGQFVKFEGVNVT